MKTQIFALFALASSATATFDWLDAKKFTCPQNTDNKCIDKQKGGFKWEGLDLGKFTKFADFDFDGFECVDSFDGLLKRDLITGRTFQNKCIKGRATEEKEKAPSFGCGSSKQVDKFSVKTFQISVEYDIDLEFHYDMPDGSLCKQKQSCKKSGTVVKNTQCGGAKKVKVVIPKGKGKGKGCNVGFHDIEFDCEPPKSTPPKTTTPPSVPSTTPVPETTPAQETTPVQETTPAQETTPVPETTPAQETTPTPSSPPETVVESTSSTYSQTQDIPTPEPTPGPSTTSDASPVSSSSAPPFPVNSTIPVTTPGETVPVVTPPATVSTFTEVITSTITSCGPEVISCPAESTVVTTHVVVSSTTVPVVTTTTTKPSVPIPTTDCPPVLPQCLNTWLFDSECKSNTDVNCFCKSDKFVEAIYQCLSAHGADEEEIDKAQNFFQGICAPHVPENPAIITDATTLTLTSTPTATTIPVTTIELQTTITVPCVQTEGPSSGAIIPGSSTTKVISTAVTVPQVVFETITGPSTQVVSLVQGTPTAPASNVVNPTTALVPTKPAAGVPTTFASINRPVNSTGTATGQPPQFTGAASRNGLTIGSVLAAGIAAALML